MTLECEGVATLCTPRLLQVLFRALPDGGVSVQLRMIGTITGLYHQSYRGFFSSFTVLFDRRYGLEVGEWGIPRILQFRKFTGFKGWT